MKKLGNHNRHRQWTQHEREEEPEVKLARQGVVEARRVFHGSLRVSRSLGSRASRVASGEYPLRNISKGKAILLLAILLVSGVFIADQGLKPTIASHLGENEIDIFHEDFASNSIAGWNTRLATYASWVGEESVRLDSNSTHSAVAITKTKFDFSVASSKQLDMMFKYGFFSTTNCCVDHAWFLTRNSTIPAEDADWVPVDDPDVTLVVRTVDTGGGGIQTTAFIQRQVTRSVAQDDPGSCAEIGSCFVSGTSTITVDTSTKKVANLLLNFTGNPSSSNPFSRIQSGQAASFTTNNVRHLPWFDFQSQQYYVGLWQVHGSTAAMAYIGGAIDIRSLNIVVKTPIPNVGSVSEFIDSSGWFGPIIRFLIGGTVFILEALATVFGFIANAFVTAMDAVGGFFGLGAIGTAIRDALTGTVNFIVNVFAVTVGWAVTLASLFQNGIGFITNFFSGSNGFVAWIISWFTSIGSLWAIVQDLWTALNTVVLTMNQILVIYYLAGMFMVYMNGWPGFRDWLQIGTTFTVKIFHLGFTIGKEMFQIILDVKRLLAQWI